MNAFKLLEAYVQLAVRGDKDVDRALARQEQRAEATEKKAEAIGSGYERGSKRAQKAVGRLTETVARLSGATDKLSKKSVSIKTSLKGDGQVVAGLEAIKDRSDDVDRADITLKTTLAGSREVLSELDRIDGVSSRIDGDTVTIRAQVQGGEQGRRQLEMLSAAASRVDGDAIVMDAEVRGVASAIGELASLDRIRGAVDGKDVDVAVDVDTGAAIGKLAMFAAALAAIGGAVKAMDSGLSAGGVRIAMIGGLAAAAAALFTPLLGALASVGSLGAAAGAGIGLVAAPVAMVVSRLTAYHKGLEESATAQKSADSAARSYADAQRGVADAQRGVAEATEQGNRQIRDAEQALSSARQDGARAVAEAERGLQEARRNAAEGIASAERELDSARDDLASATRSLTDAQEELNDAQRAEPLNQREATLDLADARDRASDAQREYNAAVREHGRDSEEATDAARNLERAQLDLQRTEREVAETRRNGSQQLQSAQDGVREAYEAQGDAADGVREAERNLLAARRDGAASVAEARRGVAEAERSAAESIASAEQGLARARSDAAGQVADAQRAVAEAQRSAAQAARAQAAAQSDLAEKTKTLPPALLALYEAAMRFGRTASREFAGAQNAAARFGTGVIRDATPALSVLAAASERTIGGLSRAWDGFVSRLRMPRQQASVGTLLGITPQVIRSLTTAVGDFGLALLNILAAAAPSAVELARGFQAAMRAFLGWSGSASAVDAVRSAVAAAGPVFRALWDLVLGVGAALFRFGAENAPAIATAIRVVSAVVTGLVHGLSWLTSTFGPLVLVGAALTPVFLGIMLIVGQLGAAVIGLVGFAAALGPVFTAVGGVLSGPVVLAIAAAVAAIALLVANWGRVKQALSPLVPVFNRVKATIQNLGTVIRGLFTGQTGTEQFRKAFASLPGPVQTAVKRIVIAWRSLRAGFQQGWAQIRPILSAVGNGIRTAVGAALRFLVNQARQALAAFRKNWPAIKQAVLPVLTAIANGIRRGAGAAFRFLLSQARVIVNWFRKNWPLIQRTASTVFNAVKRVVQAAMRFVWNNVIRPVVGAIVRFWKQNHQQITSILKAAWNTIKTIVKAAIRIVLGTIKAVMQAITGDWKGAWRTIQNVLQVAWNAIKQLVKNSLTIVKNLLSVAWNVIKSLTQKAWEAVKNFIGDKLQAANQRVKQVVGWMKDALSGAWTAIKNAAGSAWDAIKDAIGDRVASIKNTVDGFIEDIKGAINAVLRLVGLPALGEGGGSKAPTGKGNTGANTAGGKMGSTGVATGGTYLGGRWSKGPKPYRFARGGVVAQDAVGGVVRGISPHAVYGEAGDEAYVRTDKWTPQSADALAYANAEWSRRGWLPEHRHMARGGTLSGGLLRSWERLGSRLFASGGRYSNSSGTPGGQSHHDVRPEIHDRAEEIAGATGTYWNSYPGHGGLGGATEDETVDFWGSPSMASVTASQGFKTADMALQRFGSDLMYIIRQGEMWRSGWKPWPSDPHYDHTHVSWALPGGMAGQTGSPGGGGGTNPLLGIFERAWERLVQKPIVDPILGPLKNADFVLSRIAGAAAQKIPDGVKDWISGQLGSSGSSGPYKGGGNLDEWAKNGLILGNAFPPTSSNVQKIKDRAMQESGGDPNAVNDWDSNAAAGTPSKGLMQVIEPTWNSNTTDEIGQFDQNWNDPVKSVGVASRYMKSNYGHVVGATGSGYAEGGVAARGRGPRVRMPRPVERAFVAVADALNGLAGRGRARGNPGLALAPDGGVATGEALVGIAGDGGAESMVPLERYTPQGAMALRTANRTWAARGWDLKGVPTFAKGGLLGVSGGRTIQGYGADHHGVDVAAPPGTAVNAWAPTEVTKTQQMGGIYGTQVWGYVTSGGRRYGFVVGHLSRGASAGKYQTGANLGTIGNIAGITPHAHWALSTAGMPPPGNTDPMSVYGGAGSGQSGTHSEPVPGGGGSLPSGGGGSGGSGGYGGASVNRNSVRMSSGGGSQGYASVYSRQGTGPTRSVPAAGGGLGGGPRRAAIPFGDLGTTRASLARVPDGGALAERIISRLERVEDATRANKVVDLGRESRDDIKEGPRAYAGTREFGDRVNGHVDRRDEQARRQGVR